MGGFEQMLNVMLVVMLGWAGVYAVYTAIRLNREYMLFPNRFLYPANCPPEACTDVTGFIAFQLPRLWILGILCLLLAANCSFGRRTGQSRGSALGLSGGAGRAAGLSPHGARGNGCPDRGQ